jgi:hypothetical protein
MEFKFKNFKELVNIKLDKLNWIDHNDSSIISEQGFSVGLDYFKNIGVNKDKNQLLVNVYYNTLSICAVASTDPESCDKFTQWYFDIVKIIDEEKVIKIDLMREKGGQIFKKL